VLAAAIPVIPAIAAKANGHIILRTCCFAGLDCSPARSHDPEIPKAPSPNLSKRLPYIRLRPCILG